MDKKTILGGLSGALTILAIAFSILLIINSFFPSLALGSASLLVSLIPFLLAPAAGGFVAGLIARTSPLQAGLIAGLVASLIVFVAWLSLVGLSLKTVLSGLVIVFVWVVITRVFAGYAQPKLKA